MADIDVDQRACVQRKWRDCLTSRSWERRSTIRHGSAAPDSYLDTILTFMPRHWAAISKAIGITSIASQICA